MAHIHWQHKTESPCKGLAAVQRPVRAFADAVGVRIRHKTAFEDRFDEVVQRMMHHAVAERRRADEPAFGIVDPEICVSARAVGFRSQLLLQPIEVGLQIIFERRDIRLTALAFGGVFVGEPEVLP